MKKDIVACQRLARKILDDFYTLDIEVVEQFVNTNPDYRRLFLHNSFEFGCIDRNVCVLKVEVAEGVRLQKVLKEVKALRKKLKQPVYWLPFYLLKRRKLVSTLRDLKESAYLIRQSLEPTLIRGQLSSTQIGLANIFAHLFDLPNHENAFLEAVEQYYRQKVDAASENHAHTI